MFEFGLGISLGDVLRTVPFERSDVNVDDALHLRPVIAELDRGKILYRCFVRQFS